MTIDLIFVDSFVGSEKDLRPQSKFRLPKATNLISINSKIFPITPQKSNTLSAIKIDNHSHELPENNVDRPITRVLSINETTRRKNMNILEDKKRVDVTDVSKLRPELLEMSVAELERRRTEIELAIAHREKIEEEKRREQDVLLAQAAFEKMMDAFQELHGLNRLPERIKAVLTSDDGTFQPGRYLKKPRT